MRTAASGRRRRRRDALPCPGPLCRRLAPAAHVAHGQQQRDGPISEDHRARSRCQRAHDGGGQRAPASPARERARWSRSSGAEQVRAPAHHAAAPSATAAHATLSGHRRRCSRPLERDAERALDDVEQLAGAVGRQDRPREVGVAAGRRGRARRAPRAPATRREHGERDRAAARAARAARRARPPRRPAPSVMTPPTSAPSRPAPMIDARRATQPSREATARSARRARTALSAAPEAEQDASAARIVSSSLPIPKKRAPPFGFGPASDAPISGEPRARSTACATSTTAAGTAGATRPAARAGR